MEVCKSVRAAIAQQLPNGEVKMHEYDFRFEFGLTNLFWCSYVITFNSTTAMEASGIQGFLRKPAMPQLSRHLNFSTECQTILPVEVSRLSEPVISLIAGTSSESHWRVGKKAMNFDFRFGEFHARADLPNLTFPKDQTIWQWRQEQQKQENEYHQALQLSKFQEETQQLLVGDRQGCKLEPDATCHSSENGVTCWESCSDRSLDNRYLDWHHCRSQNCTRNCSAAVEVSCDLSFPPHWNDLQAVNETRWCFYGI
eukprot:Skav202228  [mRNA]  locus=scaffold2988:40069:40833:+ [translate_table: standard]